MLKNVKKILNLPQLQEPDKSDDKNEAVAQLSRVTKLLNFKNA